MRRRTILIIVCYVITFAAGTTMGLVAQSRTEPPARHRWSLTSALNLTPEQKATIDKIWSETMRSNMRAIEEDKQALVREKHERLMGVLSPEQRSRWDEIEAQYAEKFAQINARRKGLFDEAKAATRAVLNPEQQVQWDEMIVRRAEYERGDRHRRRHDGPPRGEGPARPSDSADTADTATPPPAPADAPRP